MRWICWWNLYGLTKFMKIVPIKKITMANNNKLKKNKWNETQENKFNFNLKNKKNESSIFIHGTGPTIPTIHGAALSQFHSFRYQNKSRTTRLWYCGSVYNGPHSLRMHFNFFYYFLYILLVVFNPVDVIVVVVGVVTIIVANFSNVP